jgi:hypothetical protein
MPIFHLPSAYQDTWVVLDRSLRVVDSGDHLEPLRRKHGAEARRTFCFVSRAQNAPQARPKAHWSLRGLLGHPPLTLAALG